MRGDIFATRSSTSQPPVSFLPCSALNHAASRGPTPPCYGKACGQLGEGRAESSRLPARVGFRPGRSFSCPRPLPRDQRSSQLCRRRLHRASIPNFADYLTWRFGVGPRERADLHACPGRPGPLGRPRPACETLGGDACSPTPVPHLTLWTPRARESATRASHSPLVKDSIFASPRVLTSPAPQASYSES